MASGKLWGASYRQLRGVIERSVRSFARHDMAVYATALAYRGPPAGGKDGGREHSARGEN